jgi:hypothetical protein
MKIGWLTTTTGVYGSVRLMIEASNVLTDLGHQCFIYTETGQYDNWLPCKAIHKPDSEINNDNLDCLFMACVITVPLLKIFENSNAVVKSYLMMGFPVEKVTDIFAEQIVDYVIRNYWIIADGGWQFEYIKRFTDDYGPAIGGINLQQFHPHDVKKTCDVIWSRDWRKKKGSGMVEGAIHGLRHDYYWGRGFSQSELPVFLSRGRVFVDGHQRGGFCNPVLEAMACGLVPVCTDIGCNSDFVIHGKTGYRVSNPITMRHYIDHLLRDEQERENMRQLGQLTVKQFDYGIVIPKLETAIKEHLTRC